MWCLRTLSDDIFAPQTTLIVKLHKNSLYYGCYNHSNTARAALACYHDAQGQYITHNVSLRTAAVLTQHPYIQPETRRPSPSPSRTPRSGRPCCYGCPPVTQIAISGGVSQDRIWPPCLRRRATRLRSSGMLLFHYHWSVSCPFNISVDGTINREAK